MVRRRPAASSTTGCSSVVETLKDDDLGFEPAGRQMLERLDEPVTVWSLTPRD